MMTKEEVEEHKAKVDRFLEEYEKKIEKSDVVDSRYSERALWHLLSLYKDRLPIFDGYFNKAFRQADVTDSGHSDMAIWCLLNSNVTIFWKLFDKYVEQEDLEKAGLK